MALIVSRAMMRPPIAAWMAILKSWRGIRSFSRSQSARPRCSACALVHDDAERIDRLGVDQDRHLHQLAFLVAHHLVVEAGIAARDRLQPVVEVEHHFVQRQAIDRHGARAGIGELDLLAAALLAEREHANRDARPAS